MESLIATKTLEETVEEIIQLKDVDNAVLSKLSIDTKNNIIVQRLRGELRKYLNRPLGFKQQIDYIQSSISKIQK